MCGTVALMKDKHDYVADLICLLTISKVFLSFDGAAISNLGGSFSTEGCSVLAD